MRRRLEPLQQSGRPQHQRARADARHVLGLQPLPAHEGDHFGVVHQIDLTAAAGHANDVERRAGLERHVRQQRQAGIAHDRLDALPENMHFGIRHARQHLQRPGHVELRDLGKQQQADMDGGWRGGGCGDGRGHWQGLGIALVIQSGAVASLHHFRARLTHCERLALPGVDQNRIPVAGELR